MNGKMWPRSQLLAEGFSEFSECFRRASINYKDRTMSAAADEMLGKGKDTARTNPRVPAN
jgi:hypothetical protein